LQWLMDNHFIFNERCAWFRLRSCAGRNHHSGRRQIFVYLYSLYSASTTLPPMLMPSALVMMTGRLPRNTTAAELDVPGSIPMMATLFPPLLLVALSSAEIMQP
jgi:hypothetical protein